MGAAFLVNTAYDFHEMGFGWRDNTYASLFYVILGLHALHVAGRAAHERAPSRPRR